MCVCARARAHFLTVRGCGPSTPRCQLEPHAFHWLHNNRRCKQRQHPLDRERTVERSSTLFQVKKKTKNSYIFLVMLDKKQVKASYHHLDFTFISFSRINTHVCESVWAYWRWTFWLFDSFGLRLSLLFCVTSLLSERDVLQRLRASFGKQIFIWLHEISHWKTKTQTVIFLFAKCPFRVSKETFIPNPEPYTKQQVPA